jgi:hypothetical protein
VFVITRAGGWEATAPTQRRNYPRGQLQGDVSALDDRPMANCGDRSNAVSRSCPTRLRRPGAGGDRWDRWDSNLFGLVAEGCLNPSAY